MAAQNCEIDSIGVTWGFGSKTELIQAHPTHIINEISELIQYI